MTINVIIRHYKLLKSIVSNKNAFFILKFWLLLSNEIKI